MHHVCNQRKFYDRVAQIDPAVEFPYWTHVYHNSNTSIKLQKYFERDPALVWNIVTPTGNHLSNLDQVLQTLLVC